MTSVHRVIKTFSKIFEKKLWLFKPIFVLEMDQGDQNPGRGSEANRAKSQQVIIYISNFKNALNSASVLIILFNCFITYYFDMMLWN